MNTHDTDDLKKLFESETNAQIMKDLGIEDADKEAQAEVVAEIAQVVLDRVTLEVYKALPPEAHDDFDEKIRNGNSAEAREILKEHIPNLDDFIRSQSAQAYQKIKARAGITESIPVGE